MNFDFWDKDGIIADTVEVIDPVFIFLVFFLHNSGSTCEMQQNEVLHVQFRSFLAELWGAEVCDCLKKRSESREQHNNTTFGSLTK